MGNAPGTDIQGRLGERAPTFDERALAQHTAILGKTGSGKTSTAKLAIEQVVAEGMRVCVLDPIKSDWWGLTSSADGKQPGLPFYILGGPHGHVLLHSSSGAAIGELVATSALPLSIIDMADFEPGGLQRFFTEFADTLLRKMDGGVLYLVLEEAHEFAPKEKSGIDGVTMAIHLAKKLATAGRSKGIRLILATQRTQSLHNALLGSCETMIVHRMTAPADQEPVKKWLKGNTSNEVRLQVEESLAALKTGTGWLCSGEAGIFEKVQFPRIATYDNTATPGKDSGPREVKQAVVDLEKLRAIIGVALEEEDEEKEGDADADGRRVQELIAQREAARMDCARLQEERDAAREFNEVVVGVLREERDYLLKAAQVIGELLERDAPFGTYPGGGTGQGATDGHRPPPEADSKAPARRDIPTSGNDAQARERKAPAAGLSKKQQQILDAIAWYHSIGNPEPTLLQIGAVALIDASGGHFSNVVGPLSSAGLIQRANGKISLSDKGRKVANAPERVPTLSKYHEVLRDRVRRVKSASGKTLEILDAVIGAGGKPISAERIGQIVSIDHTGGHFSNTIGPLSTLGLIKRDKGIVTPTEILFPKGVKAF